MFRVDRFQRIAHGEYQAVLTLDDPGILPALRLLRRVSDVAETLHRRIDLERRVLHLTEERQAAEPAAIAERAKILALYRTLPGPRAERLKLLRSVLKDQYPRIGYDDVRIVISRGVAEERAFRRSRAAELAGEGRSAREIGTILNISAAQAFRLSGARKADLARGPRIDDLDTRTQERALFPRSLTPGAAVAAV